jgi:hypothetical protein
MMASADFEKALKTQLQRRPFQPFRIDLDDGRQFVVGESQALSYYEGSTALFFGPDTMDFVDCVAVQAFVPLVPAPSANGEAFSHNRQRHANETGRAVLYL